MKRNCIAALLLLLLFLFAGCGKAEEAPKRAAQEIIEELAVDYGNYGAEAEPRVAELLGELKAADADAASRWERITSLWKSCNTALPLNYDVLPDGLPDTEELGIVVLGFQLAPDGSMRQELVERLNVALNSAEKYPRALIICTGGGTAAENSSVTEAGQMAAWLTEHGVAPERVLVENQSLTTAQNALRTFDLLEQDRPEVRQLAIVSSDYHIATGTLLFEAASILRAEKAGAETVHVVSNAAWKAPHGNLPATFQAGALIELSGDADTAFQIYYDTYDVHALPPLK